MKQQETFWGILLCLTLVSFMMPAFAQRDSAQQRQEQQNRMEQQNRERQAEEGRQRYNKDMQERQQRSERERNEQQIKKESREKDKDDYRESIQRQQDDTRSRTPTAAAPAPYEIFGSRFGISTLTDVRREVKSSGARIKKDSNGEPHILVTTGAASYRLPGLSEVIYTFSGGKVTLTSITLNFVGGPQLIDQRVRELSSLYKLETRLPNGARFQGPGVVISVSTTDRVRVTERYEHRR